ncbi:MAG: sulfatase-like hydrolase/transferase [Saprospiraceae bacterium]|nr:sulfatase-like hydrolase/transferase [Saprospiraceae bacterium]
MFRIFALSSLLSLLLITCSTPAPSEAPRRPNILMVMCDDLGWGDVGFNGNTQIKTPNLDSLAGQGIILNRFYAASAVCSPTRASVLTGRNPFRMGIYHANTGHLPPQEVTLPEILKTVGYATGHFGKWHLGTLTRMIEDANRGRPRDSTHYAIPTTNGYDTYFCSESKTPTWDPMIKPRFFNKEKGESLRYGWAAVSADTLKVESYGTFYWKGTEEIELRNIDGDDSRVIMDRVLPFVDQAVAKDQPFFSTIWFHTPHLPLVTSAKYRAMYANLSHRKQLLYGSITAMDEQVGRLWQHLEELGVADNTMLWFCSDNGPEIDTPGSAGPFRERKRSLYEGGVRVPAFVVWPRGIATSNPSDLAMSTSDYLPTVLDLLDLESPLDRRPLDGISVRSQLEQGGTQRGSAIGFLIRKKRSWVTDRYKLISNDDGASYEIYDLLDDPSESRELSDSLAKLKLELQGELAEWISSCARSDAGEDY